MTGDASWMLSAAILGLVLAMAAVALVHVSPFASRPAALVCRILVPESSLTSIANMDDFGIGMLGFLNAALYGFLGFLIGLTLDSWEKIR
jgi:hypothetical protein